MKLNAFGTNYAVGEGVNTRRLVNCYLEMLEGGGDGDNGYVVMKSFGQDDNFISPTFDGVVQNAYDANTSEDQSIRFFYVCVYKSSTNSFALVKVRYYSFAEYFDTTVYPVIGQPIGTDRSALLQFAGNNDTQLIMGYDVGGEARTYILDVQSNTMSAMAGQPPAVMSATRIAFVNNRWWVIGLDNNLYWSELNTPVFSAINFVAIGSNAAATDLIQINNNDLMVFTDTHTETFVPSDEEGFPMARQLNLTSEVGATDLSVNGAAEDINGTIYWLGSDEKNQTCVYRGVASRYEKISNRYIEGKLNPATSTQFEFFAFLRTYQFQYLGSHFFAIEYDRPIAGTAIYNLSTGLWHETTQTGTFVLRDILFIKGQSRLYKLSHETAPLGLPMSLEFEPIYDPNNYNRMFHAELRVKTSGTLNVSQPQLMWLDVSNDGGETFPITRTATRNIEKYCRFNCLGSSSKRVYRLYWYNSGHTPLTGVTSPNMKVGNK